MRHRRASNGAEAAGGGVRIFILMSATAAVLRGPENQRARGRIGFSANTGLGELRSSGSDAGTLCQLRVCSGADAGGRGIVCAGRECASGGIIFNSVSADRGARG